MSKLFFRYLFCLSLPLYLAGCGEDERHSQEDQATPHFKDVTAASKQPVLTGTETITVNGNIQPQDGKLLPPLLPEINAKLAKLEQALASKSTPEQADQQLLNAVIDDHRRHNLSITYRRADNSAAYLLDGREGSVSTTSDTVTSEKAIADGRYQTPLSSQLQAQQYIDPKTVLPPQPPYLTKAELDRPQQQLHAAAPSSAQYGGNEVSWQLSRQAVASLVVMVMCLSLAIYAFLL